jgi:hypothetical protein
MTDTMTSTQSPRAGNIIAELSRITCEELVPLHWAGTTEVATERSTAADGDVPAIQAADPDLPF